MKLSVLILFLFLTRTRASFLDEFTGAMASVENALGKLLNDVVADVKSTIHCTIVAMEQVLVVSGAEFDPSSDNEECYDQTSPADDRNYKLGKNKVIPDKDNRNNASKDNMDKQISSSISKVNETLVHIFDNDGHERLKDIKKVLQNETDRLTKVSLLLRQELEKISYRLKDEVRNKTSNKSSLQSLWDEIEILRDVEMNDKNVSEVNEIGQVLNEAIDVMKLNSTNDVKSDEDKIKVIMEELENESHVNNVTLENIKGELFEWNSNLPELQNSSASDVSENISEQFKKEAANLLRDNNNIANRIHEKPIEVLRKYTTEDINNVSFKNIEKDLSEYKNFSSEPSLSPNSSSYDLSDEASENFERDASNIFKTMNTRNVEYTADMTDERNNVFEKSEDEEYDSEFQDPSDMDDDDGDTSAETSEGIESESTKSVRNVFSERTDNYSTDVISDEISNDDENTFENEDNNDNLKDMKSELSNFNENTSIIQNTSGYDISEEAAQTFKNDATRMLKSNDGNSKEVDDYIDEQVNRNSERNIFYDEDQIDDVSKDFSLMDSVSSSFQGRLTKEEHEKAIDRAKDIVSDSTHTEAVLAMISSDEKSNSELVNFE